MIDVQKKNENEFTVMVEHEGLKTKHNVTLENDYYRKLTKGKITKEELIKKSFEFLLERESNQSILSSFKLQVISRYFPEYESEIGILNS